MAKQWRFRPKVRRFSSHRISQRRVRTTICLDNFNWLSADVGGFVWSITSKGGQLAVKRKAAPMILFHNFRDTATSLHCLAVHIFPKQQPHSRPSWRY